MGNNPLPPKAAEEEEARKRAEANEAVKRTTTGEPLDINTIWYEAAKIFPLFVIFLGELGETKFAAHVDLLATRELELCSAECLYSNGDLLIFGAH